jgi:hypothetical protein
VVSFVKSSWAQRVQGKLDWCLLAWGRTGERSQGKGVLFSLLNSRLFCQIMMLDYGIDCGNSGKRSEQAIDCLSICMYASAGSREFIAGRYDDTRRFSGV